MSDSTALTVTIIVVVIVFGLIFWLDRRSKPKKPLQEPVIARDQGHPGFRAVFRLLMILVFGIATIVAILFGALWVRENPVAGLPVLIVLIVIIVFQQPLHALIMALHILQAEKRKEK